MSTPTNSTHPAYASLSQRARECSLLDSSNALLDWDMQTYLPKSGSAHRAEQSAYLASWSHRLWTNSEVGDWISRCEQAGLAEGQSSEAVNLRLWRKSHQRATRLPAELVERFKRESSLGHEIWVEARQHSDFSRFQPSLTRLVELNREMAERWGYEGSPYNALLEAYEPEARSEDIRQLFESLAPAITQLLQETLSAGLKKTSLPPGPYPVEKQKTFNHRIAQALGFDFQAGRIDQTAHPFCTTLGPSDVRLTTRYDENDFTSSLYGIIHETGHGLYEQGLPSEHFGTPCGEAVSLGIHESQSRLWENQVCRRPEFWRHWFEEACHCFPQLRQSSPEALARHVNHVQRSHIRVEADEVTYDLHVILRFLLELDLFEGRLDVADLPAAWNELFEKMLGLPVPDDARGCLQDVHWSMGSFGYFATYTLGSLNAAQLHAQAHSELPSLASHLAAGNYQPLLDWLREKIHRQGRRLAPQQLMMQATGRATQSEAYLSHLRDKIHWLKGN
ncbi:MAG: carboxypeptidase M32 [Blastochloris sp.]|nr:carboxypeptidase M32 [Blastochloris sp.]